MTEIKISPSVLACDFSALGEQARLVYDAGAPMLHLDVMDGCFVPNISFGAPVISSIRKCTPAVFDAHLMIDRPHRYIEDFAAAGADIITFHTEAGSPVGETIEKIKSLGVKASLCVKPSTPVSAVFPYIEDISMVLIMTVEPGFGGQKFMPEMLDKIRALRSECDARGIPLDIEVDGGISPETAAMAAHCGANVMVAGSSVFKSDSPKEAIEKIVTAAQSVTVS